ncbi:MAG: hypothetical protein ACREQ4_15920 [Candidatus Binataceae bacterium]
MKPVRHGLRLRMLGRYLILVTGGNFLWEIFQLPGFADWRFGSWGWLIFIVLIGTAGDVLIAAISLVLAMVCFGGEQWPQDKGSYWRVAAAACVFGVIYTTYSEWRHAVVLHAWTYSGFMPVLPVLGVGLFPILQWVLIPAAVFYYLRSSFATLKRANPDDSKSLTRTTAEHERG